MKINTIAANEPIEDKQSPLAALIQFYNAFNERDTPEISDNSIHLSIRTSRIYRRVKSVWKQFHHHGSMDDPVLLAQYQNTLLKT